MKPITETQEFKAWLDKEFPVKDTPVDVRIVNTIKQNDAVLIAKAAQSILTARHEKEIVDFTMWYISWIIDNDMKFHHGKDGEIYTIERLLQLFRDGQKENLTP